MTSNNPMRLNVQDVIDYQMSRRGLMKAMIATAGLAAATGVLGACTSDDAKPTHSSGKASSAKPTVQPNGVVSTPRNQTVVTDDPTLFTVFDSFNPFIPNGEQQQGGVTQVAKEFLWYLNFSTGELKPWLAKSWSYNADSTQLTLALQTDAKWSDGKPFTSRDVKFTMDMLAKQSNLLGAGSVSGVARVAAPDAGTVVISLKAPDPRYHYNFICALVVAPITVVPEHVWSSQNPSSFKNNPPVYTGPYKLKEVQASRYLFMWEKYDTYWAKAKMDPKPLYAAFRSAPTIDTASKDFEDAKTDCGSDYDHVKALIGKGYKNAVITSLKDPAPRAILVNCDPSKGILAEPKFRWVVSALLDRDKIAKNIWVPATTSATYPWPDYPSNKKWEDSGLAADFPLSYDPDKAASLLEEIGATKSGEKITYKGAKVPSLEIITAAPTTGAEYLIGQELAKELGKLGFTVSVKSLEGAVYTDRLYKGQYDIRSESLFGEIFDPSQIYSQFTGDGYVPLGKNASSDFVRLKDDEFDSIVAELKKSSPDDAAKKETFDDALKRWFELMPGIPIIQTLYSLTFNTTYWKGWPTDDNQYQVGAHWWAHYLFVIGAIQPTGA
jgi:peptide/nickel transport system substrate-binding protein